MASLDPLLRGAGDPVEIRCPPTGERANSGDEGSLDAGVGERVVAVDGTNVGGHENLVAARRRQRDQFDAAGPRPLWVRKMSSSLS